MEFRAEAYNVTNSFRPGCATGSIVAGTCPNGGMNNDVTNRLYGELRNARPPRIMQFALKYLF